MERLTMKNSDGSYSQPTHLTFEKMFYKLAEFEDFMEEICCENLEELKQLLIANAELANTVAGLDANYICKCLLEYPTLQQENQALKDRWDNFNIHLVNMSKKCNPTGTEYRIIKYLLDKMQELEDRQ